MRCAGLEAVVIDVAIDVLRDTAHQTRHGHEHAWRRAPLSDAAWGLSAFGAIRAR